MQTLNDLLRRIPMLTLLPLLVWLFGMTAYTSSWKAETDYKLSQMLEATARIEPQTERIVALEQKIIYISDYVREINEAMKDKAK